MPVRYTRALPDRHAHVGTALGTSVPPAGPGGTMPAISPSGESETALHQPHPVLPHPAPQPACCSRAALGAPQPSSCWQHPPHAAHWWGRAPSSLGWHVRAPTAVPGARARRLPAAAPAASWRPGAPAPRRQSTPGGSLTRARSSLGTPLALAGRGGAGGARTARLGLGSCGGRIGTWGSVRAKKGAARPSSTYACRSRVGWQASSGATSVLRTRWQGPIRASRAR